MSIIFFLSIQAYRLGFRQPTHLLLTYMHPWYGTAEWWLGNLGNLSCTPAERNSVMSYVVGPANYDLITDFRAVADTGIVGHLILMA